MELTAYEKTLRHNAITAWLHSFRHRYAIRFLSEIHEAIGRPVKVVDIGCCYGSLFDAVSAHVPIEYIGIDHNAEFARIARERHVGAHHFTIVNETALTAVTRFTPDVFMALETFEHIHEHEVVRIIEHIGKVNARLFATVPVEIGPAIWLKNVGSLLCGYARHKEYTWPETLRSGLYQLDRIPPHGRGHKGFDWRWLAQTIRHNMKIAELRTFPANLPAAISTSVCFVAEPRHEA